MPDIAFRWNSIVRMWHIWWCIICRKIDWRVYITIAPRSLIFLLMVWRPRNLNWFWLFDYSLATVIIWWECRRHVCLFSKKERLMLTIVSFLVGSGEVYEDLLLNCPLSCIHIFIVWSIQDTIARRIRSYATVQCDVFIVNFIFIYCLYRTDSRSLRNELLQVFAL